MEALWVGFNERLLKDFFRDVKKGDEFIFEIKEKMHPARVKLNKIVNGAYYLVKLDGKGAPIEISMKTACQSNFILTKVIHPVSEIPTEKIKLTAKVPGFTYKFETTEGSPFEIPLAWPKHDHFILYRIVRQFEERK